jgi:endonuclease/exonuclease/phosphatase family metal-dependent hydrolase
MELRVATYNVHRCIGRDGRQDVARCFRVIEELDADVIGLQEVDGNLQFGAGQELLERAKESGYSVEHGITLRRTDADFGNALLSRIRILRLELHDISIPNTEPRGVISATLAAGGHPLRILVTHFGRRSRERRIQARRLASLAGRTNNCPMILMGDFNEWRPFAFCINLLGDIFGKVPAPGSYPAPLAIFRLDRIWVRPPETLRRIGAHRSELAFSASDHLPVVARINLASGDREPP